MQLNNFFCNIKAAINIAGKIMSIIIEHNMFKLQKKDEGRGYLE